MFLPLVKNRSPNYQKNLNAGKFPLHIECIVKLKNTLSQTMALWGNKEALSLN